MQIKNFEYQWLKNKEIFGYTPFSNFEPWYLLQDTKCFWTNEAWKDSTNLKYFVFARRQDCDDFACMSLDDNFSINRVYIIHGWTNNGFEVVQEFDGIFNWMHQVINDIKDWSKPL